MNSNLPAGQTAPREFLKILDGLGVGYYRSDAEGRFMQINDVGAQMYGYTVPEMLSGLTTHDTNASAEVRRKLIEQIREHQFVHAFVGPARRKDGSQFFVESSIRRISDADGETAGYEGVFRDVTSQVLQARRQEALISEIRKASRKLETFSELQEEILSTLAHELKTPPGIILGFAELLLRNRYGPLNDGQAKALEAIQRNARLLDESVEQLLEFSRFLRRVEPSTWVPTPLWEALVSASDRQRKECEAAGVEIILAGRPASGETMATPEVLEHLMENLVANLTRLCRSGGAVRFSLAPEECGTLLTAELAELDPAERPPLNRILGTFLMPRAAEDNDASRPSPRLGLAVTDYLMHLMGGESRLQEVGGNGIRLSLSFPAVPVHEEAFNA
ncbi:MAG: PAS domain-containing sensor histidine kinase [Acidobacteriota bacterium]